MVNFSADIFSGRQKKMLNEARRAIPDYQKDNKNLDIAIAQIKSESPHLFWTPDTLILRRFFDQPAAVIPYRSYERRYD